MQRTLVALAALTVAACSGAAGPGGGPSPAPPPAAPAAAVSGAELLVEVRGLQTEGMESPVVLLGPADGSLVLPIFIGPAEALSIAVALADYEAPRPMTHDLIGKLLLATGARLERVTVTELKEATFFARMRLRIDGRAEEVDSRPSDAIAVAMRLGAPIYVSEQVVGQAGVRRPGATATREAAPLGLVVQPLTPALARLLDRSEGEGGVVVADVRPHGAAAAAGLRPGDVILAVDGVTVSDLAGFAGAVARAEAGVTLRYGRGRTTATARIDRP